MSATTAGPWPPAHIERLKALWAEGMSASQIAKALCREFRTAAYSRSAVIGKVQRMGLQGRALPSAPERVAKGHAEPSINAGKRPLPKRAPRPPKPRVEAHASAIIRRAAMPKREPTPITFDASFAKPWTERVFGECAFPVGGAGADIISCCAPNGKRVDWPYCPLHLAVMRPNVPTAAQRKAARERQERALYVRASQRFA